MKYERLPRTESIKQRLEILLVEEVNNADLKHIDMFVTKVTNKILAIIMDELNYESR